MAKTRKEVVEEFNHKISLTKLWNVNAEKNAITEKLDTAVHQFASSIKLSYSEINNLKSNIPSWTKSYELLSSMNNKVFDKVVGKLKVLAEENAEVNEYEDISHAVLDKGNADPSEIFDELSGAVRA